MQHMPMLYASSRADALHQYSSPSPVVIASLSMPITSPCTTHPTCSSSISGLISYFILPPLHLIISIPHKCLFIITIITVHCLHLLFVPWHVIVMFVIQLLSPAIGSIPHALPHAQP